MTNITIINKNVAIDLNHVVAVTNSTVLITDGTLLHVAPQDCLAIIEKLSEMKTQVESPAGAVAQS